MSYQVVVSNGVGWTDDFEGAELCSYENEEDAIECCRDMARLWSTQQDDWGYVEIDDIGEWYESDVKSCQDE